VPELVSRRQQPSGLYPSTGQKQRIRHFAEGEAGGERWQRQYGWSL
jgi:hypothetical protein